MKRGNSYRLRFLVMLAVLALVAIGYFTAFGIGNLSAIGFGTLSLICPLGALLAMLAEHTAIPQAIISLAAVFTLCIILGKIFCSWICPVHFMSHFSRKKKKESQRFEQANSNVTALNPSLSKNTNTGEKTPERSCNTCAAPCGKTKGIKIDSRHGILAAALGSTLIFGFPVFCLICPVGLTFATVLLIMRLFAFGDTTWAIIAFPLVILIEILLIPKWCQKFCPLGALLSLMSGLNKTFRPKLQKEKCLKTQDIACDLCTLACPEGINLHNIAAGETTLNDCSKCRVCADVCPKGAISFPFLAARNTGSKKLQETDNQRGQVSNLQGDDLTWL